MSDLILIIKVSTLQQIYITITIKYTYYLKRKKKFNKHFFIMSDGMHIRKQELIQIKL